MKTLLFLLLPLGCFGQAAFVRHYKVATATDTVFSVASGLLRIDTAITINGTSYPATPGDPYTPPLTGYTYTPYTLSNGWSAIVTRFCNGELEAVTVDEGSRVETWYCR